jgi:hypothetical protein
MVQVEESLIPRSIKFRPSIVAFPTKYGVDCFQDQQKLARFTPDAAWRSFKDDITQLKSSTSHPKLFTTPTTIPQFPAQNVVQ